MGGDRVRRRHRRAAWVARRDGAERRAAASRRRRLRPAHPHVGRGQRRSELPCRRLRGGRRGHDHARARQCVRRRRQLDRCGTGVCAGRRRHRGAPDVSQRRSSSCELGRRAARRSGGNGVRRAERHAERRVCRTDGGERVRRRADRRRRARRRRRAAIRPAADGDAGRADPGHRNAALPGGVGRSRARTSDRRRGDARRARALRHARDPGVGARARGLLAHGLRRRRAGGETTASDAGYWGRP